MTAVTWLGDSDPSAQVITLFGTTFVKGESVSIMDKKALEKLKDNPMFSTKAGDKPAEADEAEQPEETGTVKAGLRDALKAYNVTMSGNASEETLRKRLAELAKADT